MWFKETPNGIVLFIRAQPKTSRTEIFGLHGDPPRLKIRLAAPPIDGQANEELLKFLKKTLNVRLSDLQLIQGETSPNKSVLCSNVDVEKIKSLIK